ncbi:MAG: hypothetical protein M0Z53_03020 [Thermaerobacter sp.]|nr:hypothetical protein [Thermaerobacter sp.]
MPFDGRVAAMPRQSFTRQPWHFTLKTGVPVKDGERLQRAVTLYSVVS